MKDPLVNSRERWRPADIMPFDANTGLRRTLAKRACRLVAFAKRACHVVALVKRGKIRSNPVNSRPRVGDDVRSRKLISEFQRFRILQFPLFDLVFRFQFSTFLISTLVFRSVLNPIIRVFNDFVLEGDHAFLMPPPVVRSVANRIDGDDVDGRFGVPKFLAEYPAGAAGVKRVGGNKDGFRAGLFHPDAHGPGFVIGTGDIGTNHGHGRFRDAIAQQDSAGQFPLRRDDPHFLGRAEPDIHVKNDRSNSVAEEFGRRKRSVFEAATGNDNRIGFGHRVVDHPGIGQTREQRGAKNVPNQEQDTTKGQTPRDPAQPTILKN